MTDSPDLKTMDDADAAHLASLYAAAFPGEDLMPLVLRLLAEVPDLVSLAATTGDELMGHVLFTPCGVNGSAARVALLGPLAVAPGHQKREIGSALVREGLRRMRADGFAKVLVLGDPAYYGRFGFRSETAVTPPFALPAAWAGAWQAFDCEAPARPVRGMLLPPAPWLQPALWLP